MEGTSEKAICRIPSYKTTLDAANAIGRPIARTTHGNPRNSTLSTAKKLQLLINNKSTPILIAYKESEVDTRLHFGM